ncbi:hypothetical protein [Pseudomonas lini]|uniref:Uncharacterized protein n=1 Tax=Pseudomonas lini TaxID=163011 RepID=A0A0J6KFM7_9PSED|nr:hypothetical protein [Pseudomonas lini]KAB0502762.1 hypothetical protein F7R14_19180 [Pseudomonas lini]KMM94957.1 hypothetical protein TU81_00565 [Pseudomonas lini]SDT22638.1 hypothetical protein SAMN04490191_3563 [Pseudomonas lini]
MSLTVPDRISIIRRGIEDAQKDPFDLFGARMMIHEAFNSWGVDTTWVAGFLLPVKAPITSTHLDTLDMITILLDHSPEFWSAKPAQMCEMVRLIAG